MRRTSVNTILFNEKYQYQWHIIDGISKYFSWLYRFAFVVGDLDLLEEEWSDGCCISLDATKLDELPGGLGIDDILKGLEGLHVRLENKSILV